MEKLLGCLVVVVLLTSRLCKCDAFVWVEGFRVVERLDCCSSVCKGLNLD